MSYPRTCTACGLGGCIVFRPDRAGTLPAPQEEVSTERAGDASPGEHWLQTLLSVGCSAQSQAKRGTQWPEAYDRGIEVLELVREMRAGPLSTESLNKLARLMVGV